LALLNLMRFTQAHLSNSVQIILSHFAIQTSHSFLTLTQFLPSTTYYGGVPSPITHSVVISFHQFWICFLEISWMCPCCTTPLKSFFIVLLVLLASHLRETILAFSFSFLLFAWVIFPRITSIKYYSKWYSIVGFYKDIKYFPHDPSPLYILVYSLRFQTQLHTKLSIVTSQCP